MAYGFFNGGLADLDRDDRQRRYSLGGKSLTEGAREEEHSSGVSQALQDAAALASRLGTAFQNGSPEIYGRLKAMMMPMLTRRIAVVTAARHRIPFDDALNEAEHAAQSVVDTFERRLNAVGAPTADQSQPGGSASLDATDMRSLRDPLGRSDPTGQSIPPDDSSDQISMNSAICRALCSNLALPTKDDGFAFRRCMRACESDGKSGFPKWDKIFRP
jgi:hypothetical protein